MEKYWFKAKQYGYGWYPATKEGFLVMLLWMLSFIAGALLLVHLIVTSGNVWGILLLIPYIAVTTGLLFWICYKRGEPARWRWGEDKQKRIESWNH
ncbi:MAG TPA: hypothetical protein VHD55_00325 [Candidatus Paceibacterota bacterium]|nr:hypothetical protein [Candidatus Paceibacterota bacterium]